MNFFERQHRARRRTALLVAYFLLAVVLIIAALNALVFAALYTDIGLSGARAARLAGLPLGERLALFLAQPYWAYISAAVLALIGLRSALSLLQLSGGGESLAGMVGARRVDMDSQDPAERRLINCVEEMAIASGTGVPALYIMDQEPGINAFVAGYEPDAAVMVVTAGALEQLERDELQGVIGHEYSHILNGDMRLNVHLISVLAGVLVLGQIGGFLLRSMARSRIRAGGRGGGSGQGLVLVLGAGLALFVLGYIGLFFGRLIKAAVARQRELLADAASVQFTRNPRGIAGALWKIKQAASGSRLANLHAEDMSHMCFGETMRYALSGLFATHPPIDERIAAIDPAFAARARSGQVQRAAGAPEAGPGAAEAPPAGAAGFAGGAVASSAEAIADTVGNPTPAHVARAEQLHAAIPPAVLRAAHRPAQAPAVAYALLLWHMDPADRPAGGEAIAREHNEALRELARHLAGELGAAAEALRLPLLELALPALRSAAPAERRRVLASCRALVAVDSRVSLFELVLTSLLERQLGPEDAGEAVEHTGFEPVLGELRTVFAALARSGAAEAGAQRAAYARALAGFEPPAGDPVLPPPAGGDELGQALQRLRGLAPILKRSVLQACAEGVLHDGRVLLREAELLRAVAASLGCPMPPLLAGR